MDRLPPELLYKIAEYLSDIDIINLPFVLTPLLLSDISASRRFRNVPVPMDRAIMERLDRMSKHAVIARNVQKLWFMTERDEGSPVERFLEDLWTEQTIFDDGERRTSPYEVTGREYDKASGPGPLGKKLLVANPVSRGPNPRAKYQKASRTALEKLADILGRIPSPDITFDDNAETFHTHTTADLECDTCGTPCRVRESRMGLVSLFLKALVYSGRQQERIEILHTINMTYLQSINPLNFPRITDFLPPILIRLMFQNIGCYDIRSSFFDAKDVAPYMNKRAGDDVSLGQIGAIDTVAAMLNSAHLLEEPRLVCTDKDWIHGGIPPSYLPLGTPLTGSNPLLHLRTLYLNNFRTNQPELVDF
jgi:hypothetical protein